MTLRSKAFLTVALIMCSLIAVVFAMVNVILKQRSLKIEEQLVLTDVKRVIDTLSDEIDRIDKFTIDWSGWDDTYDFVKTQSETYIKTNLLHGVLLKQQLSFMVFVNASGKIIYSTGLSMGYDNETPVPESLLQHIAGSPVLNSHPDKNSFVKGIIALPECLAMIVSRPVLTSEYKGPVAGALIIGKYLSPTLIKMMVKQTQLSFELIDINAQNLPSSIVQPLRAEGQRAPVLVRADSPDKITGYQLLKNVYKKPCAIVSTHVPRLLYSQYLESLKYFVAAFIVITLLTAAIIFIIADRVVLSRLAKLSAFLMGIQSTEKLSDRITLTREDEISAIKAGVNSMLQKLEHDVAQLKQAEQKTQEALNFLENIFTTSADGIMLIGKNNMIEMANDAMEKMFGYSTGELIGKKVTDFDPPGDTCFRKGIEFVARLFEEKVVYSFERQYRRKDGSLIDVELSGALLKDSTGNTRGAVTVFRNITERKKVEAEKKKLEEQLQRSEKMETVGLLAGGVAHDLNNMLGAIVGYPELLLDDLPGDSPLRPAIKAIKDSGERAAAIVQDLLTLTRRGVTVNEIVNLNALVRQYGESRECAKLKEFHPDVSLQQNLDPALLNLIGSPVHLLKVIANLVSNAAEAITRAGTIQISTENRHLDKPVKGYDQIVAGDYAVLCVEDNGIGIAEADLQRIFEPFYTKKVMGRSGTGLGMSVVWGTVKDHGGYIDLVSRQGQGTAITLYFPATRSELQEQAVPFSLENYRGSGQTILVVDDVEAQRSIARAILTKLRYRVVTVASGEEAVEYLKNNTADLLVLDMIMDPGMDGLDTYRKILELHPGQKAIIASGYSETDHVRQAQALGAGAYVKKPYTIEKLGLAVKNELAG